MFAAYITTSMLTKKNISLLFTILVTNCTLVPTNPDPLPCDENSTGCFRCKIDGDYFTPNGPWKSTPLQAYLKDSGKHLEMWGNNGGKSVAIVLKSTRPIESGTYALTSWPISVGYYGSGTTTFRTGPSNPGSLTITSLTAVVNQVNQPVISGAFSFTGLDSLTRKQVAVTKGFFRVRYIKY